MRCVRCVLVLLLVGLPQNCVAAPSKVLSTTRSPPTSTLDTMNNMVPPTDATDVRVQPDVETSVSLMNNSTAHAAAAPDSNTTSGTNTTAETGPSQAGSGATVETATSSPGLRLDPSMFEQPLPMPNSPIHRVITKDLLIAVVSAPKHEAVRKAIRSTWGKSDSQFSASVDVRFFVGDLPSDMPEREELEARLQGEAGVVRLTGFTESYYNLTTKAKGIFEWAFSHGYRALLKVDDDSYVRVDNAIAFLDSQGGNLDSLYAGHINRQEYGECYVHKNPSSKWYMYDQYPHEQFPDFADGPGFMLGSSALQYLTENKDVLPNYRCDDAAVGIWTELLNLTKVEMPVAIYEFECKDTQVLINPVSAAEMYTLYQYPYICEAGYTIDVCVDRPCLCKGHPDRSSCWGDTIDKPYEDVIPRLL